MTVYILGDIPNASQLGGRVLHSCSGCWAHALCSSWRVYPGWVGAPKLAGCSFVTLGCRGVKLLAEGI